MAMDIPALTAKIKDLGRDLTPGLLEGSGPLMLPFHEQEPYQDIVVTRDRTYGTHARHRLDVFQPLTASGPLPVFVFVHGGGFMRGDKKMPGSPYNDNVPLWAARHGMVGVNITYRYAPEIQWPEGSRDVGDAIAWVRANIAQHGGDPDRIILAGTSAGGTHAASYVTEKDLHVGGSHGLAGVIFFSGIYDFDRADRSPMQQSYLGDDEKTWGRATSVQGIVDSGVPLLVAVAEVDPVDFQKQAANLIAAYAAKNGKWPRVIQAVGHNHLTLTQHLNTPDTRVGDQVMAFIAENT